MHWQIRNQCTAQLAWSFHLHSLIFDNVSYAKRSLGLERQLWGVECRADSRFAPSQWEAVLHCNGVSHWLGTSLESALECQVTMSHSAWHPWSDFRRHSNTKICISVTVCVRWQFWLKSLDPESMPIKLFVGKALVFRPILRACSQLTIWRFTSIGLSQPSSPEDDKHDGWYILQLSSRSVYK